MKLRFLFTIGLAISSLHSFGQTKDSLTSDWPIIEDPRTYPSFPGGDAALNEYIVKNLNWAPGSTKVEGKVFVDFVVDVDGNIMDVKIVRGLCESCDMEALRLVRNMPVWTAGSINGKKIKTKMTIPIKFGL